MSLQSEAVNFNKQSTNTFALVLPMGIPGNVGSEFILNIHSCSLPGLDMGSKDMRWQGGVTHMPDAVANWGSFTAQFMVDERLSNWTSLMKWMLVMHNNKDKYTADTEEYSRDASLILLDNWKKPIVSFTFIKLWPQSLAECAYSYRNGEQYIESSITFKYDRFEIVD